MPPPGFSYQFISLSVTNGKGYWKPKSRLCRNPNKWISSFNDFKYLLNSTIISSFKNGQYLVIDFKFDNSKLNYWLMLDIIYKYYKGEILIKDYKESFTIIKFI